MTEWIKCSDRFPKNNQQVLVHYKFDPADGSLDYANGYKLTHFSFGAKVYEYPKDKPGYILSHWDEKQPNWGLDDRYTITHWAELPAPPNSTYSEEKGGYIRGMMATPDLTVEP